MCSFYTLIPTEKNTRPRTFCCLPSPSKRHILKHWYPNENGSAATEVDAHVSMFNIKVRSAVLL